MIKAAQQLSGGSRSQREQAAHVCYTYGFAVSHTLVTTGAVTKVSPTTDMTYKCPAGIMSAALRSRQSTNGKCYSTTRPNVRRASAPLRSSSTSGSDTQGKACLFPGCPPPQSVQVSPRLGNDAADRPRPMRRIPAPRRHCYGLSRRPRNQLFQGPSSGI